VVIIVYNHNNYHHHHRRHLDNNSMSSSVYWARRYAECRSRDCVRRLVKWTWTVTCCVHSLTSRGLCTCRWTVKVSCWWLTTAIIAFYWWTLSCSWNESLSTKTLKSRCGTQRAYLTTNSQLSCTFYTTAAAFPCCLASCHSSVYDDLLTTVTMIYNVTCFVCHDFLSYLRISYNLCDLPANSANTQFFHIEICARGSWG